MIRGPAHRTMRGMKTAAKEKTRCLLLATIAWLLALVLWPSFSLAASPDVTTEMKPTFDIHTYDVDVNEILKPHYAAEKKLYLVVYWFDVSQPEQAPGFIAIELRWPRWAPEMSLYRGYFGVNGVDPSGEGWISCRCRKYIGAGFKDNTSWWVTVEAGFGEIEGKCRAALQ